MRTALITGSGGFVGPYLTSELEVHGGWKLHHFDLKLGHDIRDYEQIRAAVENLQPDYVFHLAAQAYVAEGVSDPRRAMDVNAVGTLNLLEAVRHTGCRAKILITGTSEEYGYEDQPGPEVTEDSPCMPATPYGVSKLAASTLGLSYAKQHGLHVVVTRAFNHTGAGRPAQYADSAFARRIAKAERDGSEVLHGNLDAVRNYSDVLDVVRAYRLAIDLPSGVYNVCSDNSVSMKWVLDTLVGFAANSVRTRLDESLYRPSGSAVFHPPSHAKLTAATGWEPQIPLEQTLRDVYTYWQERS